MVSVNSDSSYTNPLSQLTKYTELLTHAEVDLLHVVSWSAYL